MIFALTILELKIVSKIQDNFFVWPWILEVKIIRNSKFFNFHFFFHSVQKTCDMMWNDEEIAKCCIGTNN